MSDFVNDNIRFLETLKGIPVIYPNPISKTNSRRYNMSNMGFMIKSPFNHGTIKETFLPTDGGWMYLNATDEERPLIAELMCLERDAGESADLVSDGHVFDDDVFDESEDRFRCIYPDLGGES